MGPVSAMKPSAKIRNTAIALLLTVGTVLLLAVGGGAIRWWPGDGSGEDKMGGDPGVAEGSASFAPGVMGQGFGFPDSGAGVMLPYESLDGLNQSTFMVWLKTSKSPEVIISGASQQDASEFRLGIPSAGSIRLQIRGSSFLVPVDGVADGEFHQLAWVRRESGKNEIYVDGVRRGAGELIRFPFSIDPRGLWLGQAQVGVGVFNPERAFIGAMDEVEIHNRAFYSDEVESTYVQQARLVALASSASGDAGQSAPAAIAELVADVSRAVVRVRSDAGEGSGMIIGRNGLVLTAAHVVEDDNEPSVLLANGLTYPASLVALDTDRDVAVLKIEETDLPTVDFGSSADLSVGDDVLLFGHSLSLPGPVSVTKGVVSAVRQGALEGVRHIQTDADCAVGCSGGPMVNLDGEVVGVVLGGQNAIQVFEGVEISAGSPIGFALAIDSIRELLDSVD